MKTIVITRKYWGRDSLLGDNNKKCCLGFCSIAYGLRPKDIFGFGTPSRLPNHFKKKLPKWLVADSAFIADATDINDGELPMPQKEERLKKLFLKNKIRLVFRGKP